MSDRMGVPVSWYVGATMEEAQRRYEEDADRAWAAGYEVVRVDWDTRQPRPTLLVEYRLSEEPTVTGHVGVAGSSPEGRPLGAGVLVGAGLMLAGLVGLSGLIGDRDGGRPSSAPPVARSATRSSEGTPPPSVVPRSTPGMEMPTERPANAMVDAIPTRGLDAPDPTPALTLTPEPTPTLEPIPVASPVPDTASVTEPLLREWSPELSWRWLENDEFQCESGTGRCWGLLVRASAACPDGLTVAIETKDARGRFTGSVSATRRSERRGREYVLVFESPNPAARKAKVTGMVCD